MKIPFTLTFSNYRSIVQPVTIPFARRVTFIVGPNNAGKSNILRFLATLFNSKSTDDTYDFASSNKQVSIVLTLQKEFFETALSRRPNALRIMSAQPIDSAPLAARLTKDGFKLGSPPEDFFKLLHKRYFSDRTFLEDFNQSGNPENNASMLLSSLDLKSLFKGTIHVPNVRFITTPGVEPPQFSASKFPGDTIAFGTVIEQLARMDRPAYADLALQDRLRDICAFMEYALEKQRVSIEIPSDRQSIIVDIDGTRRPISSLGTGVEQTLMIGLASFGFPGKLVLIDEPELHLHPRAQKRVLSYLNDSQQSQFVVATHSAAVLDAVEADVIQVSQNGLESEAKLIRTEQDRFRAVRDLGHSPSELIQTRFAIWVEGPSDRVYLNHWLRIAASDLKEGIDYSILFYGGRVLSHHGFDDVEADLVRALSLSRSFAVIVDSDRKKQGARINATKARVKNEVEKQGGLCWITEGREIENYLPSSVLDALAQQQAGVNRSAGKHGQVINADKINKVDFARSATNIAFSAWPLDLKKQIDELVRQIRAAK